MANYKKQLLIYFISYAAIEVIILFMLFAVWCLRDYEGSFPWWMFGMYQIFIPVFALVFLLIINMIIEGNKEAKAYKEWLKKVDKMLSDFEKFEKKKREELDDDN